MWCRLRIDGINLCRKEAIPGFVKRLRSLKPGLKYIGSRVLCLAPLGLVPRGETPGVENFIVRTYSECVPHGRDSLQFCSFALLHIFMRFSQEVQSFIFKYRHLTKFTLKKIRKTFVISPMSKNLAYGSLVIFSVFFFRGISFASTFVINQVSVRHNAWLMIVTSTKRTRFFNLWRCWQMSRETCEINCGGDFCAKIFVNKLFLFYQTVLLSLSFISTPTLEKIKNPNVDSIDSPSFDFIGLSVSVTAPTWRFKCYANTATRRFPLTFAFFPLCAIFGWNVVFFCPVSGDSPYN